MAKRKKKKGKIRKTLGYSISVGNILGIIACYYIVKIIFIVPG